MLDVNYYNNEAKVHVIVYRQDEAWTLKLES